VIDAEFQIMLVSSSEIREAHEVFEKLKVEKKN
jgi:hypothetical protein